MESAPETSHNRALTVIKTLEAHKNLPKHRDRVPFHRLLQIVLISQTSKPSLAVHTRDLSATGMSFVGRRPLRLGERFTIRLPYRNLPGKLALCLVKHCSYASQGMYVVDVNFEEVQTLTSHDCATPEEWIVRAKER